MSASVVLFPNVMRIVPWTAAWGRPVARSTCEGERDLESQAEPVETHIPASSRWSRSASPSMSSINMFALFGSLFSGCPLRYVRGMVSRIPLTSLSLSSVRRVFSFSLFSCASSRAFAIPTIAGTFSVPLREPFSWPPPRICGLRGVPVFLKRTPTPFGPYILLPLSVMRSMPSDLVSMSSVPAAWHASVWKTSGSLNEFLCSWTSVASSFIGSIVPISLFAYMIEAKIVCSVRAFANRS